MKDPRRVSHPAPPGRPDAGTLTAPPHVVVIGGGIAGLAAATGLAERGVTVDVVEREPNLGGRVAGWTEQPEGLSAPVANNRGFHAFFRQYYNLREMLRRSDPTLSRLRAVQDYPLVDGEGREDTFRGLPQSPPWNALVFALRSPTFRFRDLVRIDAKAAAPLAAVSVPGIYDRLDDRDAGTFLTDIRFPDAARHLAFEVFARSFFARPERLSAAELAAMFHIYFLGSSEGLIFDVAESNFDTALWNPLAEYLTGRGVKFHTSTEVESVSLGGPRRFMVRTGGAVIEADAVVLAADVGGLQRIIEASDGLGDPGWRERVAAMQVAPPFVVQRLWLDAPVRPDRPPFLGTGGLEPVDNISVVSSYERQAADWAHANRGSVVEVHSYSVIDPPPFEGLRERMLARLHQIYPETARAGIVAERVLFKQDCPLFSPGSFAGRPTVDTPVPGLVLAGDGIRIDLPVALMERAATTGWSAANRLLSSWGIAGHTLYTVPVRGRSPVLRGLAERGMR